MIRPQKATIDINGLRLHYLQWNPDAGQGPSPKSIVLLHGSNGNARIWEEVGGRTAAHIHTVALDLRGHGDSQWSEGAAYGCKDYAGDLEQLIARLDLQRVVLVAHSMSVYHSLRYWAGHPDNVAGLILVDIEAAARPEHVTLLRTAGAKPEPRFESFDQVLQRERRFFPFADEAVLRAFVASNLRNVAADDGAAFGLTYKYDRASLAAFEAYDEWANLRQVRCPVIFVYGADSQMVRPEVMRQMVEAVPGSRAVKVEQAGHMPHVDNPSDFAEAVLLFCQETD